MHAMEGKKFVFFHNGDFSEDIKVYDKTLIKEVTEVPFEDIKKLVATWVRGKIIGNLEEATDDEVLLRGM